jgi:hypothetical protein
MELILNLKQIETAKRRIGDLETTRKHSLKVDI